MNIFKIVFILVFFAPIFSEINTQNSILSFISGCTDPNADNCSENCLQCGGDGVDDCDDDGSCEYSGCNDPNAENCSENCLQCGGDGVDDCDDDGSCEYAPVLSAVSDVTFDEDLFTSIILSATDDDSVELIYSVDGGSEDSITASLDGDGFTVNFSAAAHYFGNESFTASVTDGTYSDSQNFTVTVTSVNDDPVIQTSTDLQATIGNLFEYTIEVDDAIDNDNSFTFTFEDNPFGVDMESHSELAIVSYTPSDTDTFVECLGKPDNDCFTFTIKVEDGDGGEDIEEFYVEIVETDNELPTVTLTNSDNDVVDEDSVGYEIDEDSNLLIQFTIDDDDDFDKEDLTLLCTYNDYIDNQSSEITGSYPNFSASFSLLSNWNGEFDVTIIADDVISHYTYSFIVDVFPINDDPYLTNFSGITFEEGADSEEVRKIFFRDIDSDVDLNDSPYDFSTMEYELSTAQNIQYTEESGGDGDTFVELKFFTNDDDFNGSENFTMTINDGESDDIQRTFSVTVTNVNDAPILDDISDEEIDEDGDPLEIDIIASDIDEDILTYSASLDKDFATVSFSDNTMTLTPDEHYYGVLAVTVTVRDDGEVDEGGELDDEDSFILTITTENDAPYTEDKTVSLDEDQDENEEFSLYGTDGLCTADVLTNSDGTITCDCNSLEEGACDIEDEDLTFSITSHPSLGTSTIDDSIISYAPDDDENGPDELTYQVCDQESLCSQGIVTFNISATNDDPTADSAFSTFEEDIEDGKELTLIGNDIDGDDLSYTISKGPSHGTIEFNGDEPNMITYTPDANYFGADQFTFEVSDGQETAEAIYSLTITSVNDIPVLENLADDSIDEDETYTLELSASDVEDTLIELDFNPSVDGNGTASAEGSTLTVTPDEHFNGEIIVTVEVSDTDDGKSESKSFILTVNALNDEPVLASISDVSFDEDGSTSISLEASDVEDGNESDLTFSISDGSNIVPTVSGSEITFDPALHYNGNETFTITVTDSGDLSDFQSITITIDPVNDQPRTKKIVKSIGEECTIPIDLDGTESNKDDVIEYDLCNENDDVIDGIACSCDDDDYSVGACDIEDGSLTYSLIKLPDPEAFESIDIDENTGIITYTPAIDYITPEDSADIIQYKICDSGLLCSEDDDTVIYDEDNECVDENQCPIIEITVGRLNDSPIVNCPDNDCDIFLSDNLELSEEQVALSSEDCSLEESESNSPCDDVDGITINQLRLGYDSVDGQCSEQHLWYDADCNDGGDNEHDFGIAVDISSTEDDSDKGEWRYKINQDEHDDGETESFNIFTSYEGCDYKLLDENDEIKFYPNTNYYNRRDEEADGDFPTISFYAWDTTEYFNDDDSCIDEDLVEGKGNSKEDCIGKPSISDKDSPITLQIIIESVNDSPQSTDIDPVIYSEFCTEENNLNCGDEIQKIPINFFDDNDPTDDLYYYISSITTSSNNETDFFTNGIGFTAMPDEIEDLDDIDDGEGGIIDLLVNVNLLFDSEIIEDDNGQLSLIVKLNEYVNGEAQITIRVVDREDINNDEIKYDEQTVTITVNQVNNKIGDFEILPNIYSYEDFAGETIDNQRMIYPFEPAEDDDLFIKYPPYVYDGSNLSINDINEDNYRDIYTQFYDEPYEMEDMYFMWTRKDEEGNYLDFDIYDDLNADPYKLNYRIEFIDDEDRVFVIKDKILDSDFDEGDLEYGYQKVIFDEGPYKTYIDGDLYNPDTASDKEIDTTGLTSYNWRVVGANYQNIDTQEGYDIDNTPTAKSNRSYFINLHIPRLNHDFVLNDLYTNYFDLYLSPIPTTYTGVNNYWNVTLNENSEIYFYSSNNISNGEILVMDEISFEDGVEDQNIFSNYGAFNEYGDVELFFPIQNHVETMNVQFSRVTYDTILPNSFNSIDSESGNFNIEFTSNSQFNILTYEQNRDDVIINDESTIILSDLFVINTSLNMNTFDIRLNYDIDHLLDNHDIDFDNISYALYNDGEIEKISTTLVNGKLTTLVNDFGSYLLTMGDSQDSEIPLETSIISCYPNPFNPSTTISYELEEISDVELAIYNIMGQKIFNTFKTSLNKGFNQFTWNGKDNNGNLLSSGIYIVKINTYNKILTQKITLLK